MTMIVQGLLIKGGRATRPGGFTLIELLVVILIILMVSAVTLPSVISAFNHRQVSEAARILQGGLVGARDTAINTNAPAGIRLLPDPVFNGQSLNAPGVTAGVTALDPRVALASNRFVPIQLAPDYSEGFVRVDLGPPTYTLPPSATANTYFNYPASKSPSGVPTYYLAGSFGMLYLEQEVFDRKNSTPTLDLLNPPTSWYWNIRIGDKVRINGSGIYYTVVGPMQIANPELFVNVGDPGVNPPLLQTSPTKLLSYPAEFLFLVNGLDDNNDGFADNGWDGIDNDGDGIVDQITNNNANPLTEWVEVEQWQGSLTAYMLPGATHIPNLPYTISRRPVVSPGARETALPGDTVIDLTSWNANLPERSRLPVDPSSGSVDILLNTDGSVLPTTVYSSPTSFGISSAFYHFWVAERGDVYSLPLDNNGNPVPLVPTYSFYLPMPLGSNLLPNANAYDQLVASNPNVPALKGEIRLLSLFSRTGQILVSDSPVFNIGTGGVNQPYILPQQGARGGP